MEAFTIKNVFNYKKPAFWILSAVLIVVLLAGFFLIHNPVDTAVEQEKQDVISLVKEFGNALKTVSLSAPDEIVAESIKEQYSDFISPELLAKWQSDPQSAPGRVLSSPWPDRIDVISIEDDGNDGYVVSGEIIEVTNAEQQSGVVACQITLKIIKQDNQWLISNIEISK